LNRQRGMVFGVDLLPRILAFLNGERPTEYRDRIMLHTASGQGDFPELIAASQVYKRHIVVITCTSRTGRDVASLKHTHIDFPSLPFIEENTTYVVRVEGNHYHACTFSREEQVDVSARVLLPRGFYVEEIQRDRHSVFRALARDCGRRTKENMQHSRCGDYSSRIFV
jgi:hypothetical protein